MATASSRADAATKSDHRCRRLRRPGTAGQWASRLLRDETAATATEYVVAAAAVALGALAAAVAIAGVMVNYLHRIYLVVTLPVL